ncbi:MAG TPA: hypothetical protein VFG83_02835 [Kofleriaceae bacterium]|nr:hypothetical protein [Kofleriaceae bacterium]
MTATDDVPFADSLCHGCRFVRVVRSGKGTAFVMCKAPGLPKYGPQPVIACPCFAVKPPLAPGEK